MKPMTTIPDILADLEAKATQATPRPWDFDSPRARQPDVRVNPEHILALVRWVKEIERVHAEQFHSGTRVTNCVVHMGLALDARPEDCRLCRADIINQLNHAIRVNEWLNVQREKIGALLAGHLDAGEGQRT